MRARKQSSKTNKQKKAKLDRSYTKIPRGNNLSGFSLSHFHGKAPLTARAFHGVHSLDARQAQHLFAMLTLLVNVRFTVASLVFLQYEMIFDGTPQAQKALIFDLPLVYVAREHPKEGISQQNHGNQIQDQGIQEYIRNIDGKRHKQHGCAKGIASVSAAQKAYHALAKAHSIGSLVHCVSYLFSLFMISIHHVFEPKMNRTPFQTKKCRAGCQLLKSFSLQFIKSCVIIKLSIQ